MSSPTLIRPPAGETYTDTVRRMAQAQKPAAQGAPAYSRFVNRRIGRFLAAGAYHAGLTPNQVTAISAAFSLVAIVGIAVAPATWLTGVLVALGLLLGYAFDSADGQLARLRGGGSPVGEWLDHVVDSVKTVVLHLAILLAWYRTFDLPDAALLIPLGFMAVQAVFFFVQILTDQLRRAHPGQAPKPADMSLKSVLRSLVVWPTDFGVLCLSFVLYGWHLGFEVLYTAMLAGTTLFLVAALPKWFREVSTFGARSAR